ncbi:hypothetical protein I4U23_015265 [Adineta vaga]|nr:hypothetical protein I4U23_015265 [Adineta vaga]
MLQSQSLVILVFIVLVSYANSLSIKPIRPIIEEQGLRIGGTQRVCGDVELQINSIQDSRCPANVMCIWAGQATVQVSLSNKVTSSIVDLVLGAAAINVAEVTLGTNVYTVTLKNVVPYPGTGMNNKPKEAIVEVMCS